MSTCNRSDLQTLGSQPIMNAQKSPRTLNLAVRWFIDLLATISVPTPPACVQVMWWEKQFLWQVFLRWGACSCHHVFVFVFVLETEGQQRQ